MEVKAHRLFFCFFPIKDNHSVIINPRADSASLPRHLSTSHRSLADLPSQHASRPHSRSCKSDPRSVNGTRRLNRKLLSALETPTPRRCLGGRRSDGEGVAGGELREVVIETQNGFGVEPRYPAWWVYLNSLVQVYLFLVRDYKLIKAHQ
jgi:hypothetical protein